MLKIKKVNLEVNPETKRLSLVPPVLRNNRGELQAFVILVLTLLFQQIKKDRLRDPSLLNLAVEISLR